VAVHCEAIVEARQHGFAVRIYSGHDATHQVFFEWSQGGQSE
jgi:hypothetical protein